MITDSRLRRVRRPPYSSYASIWMRSTAALSRLLNGPHAHPMSAAENTIELNELCTSDSHQGARKETSCV